MRFNHRYAIRALSIGLIINVVLLTFSSTSYSQVNETETRVDEVNSKKISSPSPGVFPIVALTVFNKNTGPQEGDLKGVEDCGFNLCMDSPTDDQIDKLLHYVKKTNLKLILFNPLFIYPIKNWETELPSFVNKYKNDPSVAGWEFTDEPRWNDLSKLKKHYDLLTKTDDKHFIQLNLVGQLAAPFTGPCKTLESYLDSIQNVFDPDVWSSDYYPILETKGKFLVNYQNFYDDLQVFSNKAKQTGKPMWSYCESMEYTAKSHSRPAATVPYLSFEAFSALAYGAQGIVYWTYRQRPSNAEETYLSALVDLDGNKTKAWYAAKKVNFDIRALTPVFLGAEMVECKHTGNIPMREALSSISGFGPLESLTNGEKGVLASHLKNDGHDYLILVNHDVLNNQKVNLKFLKDVRVEQLKVSSGKIKRKSLKKVTRLTLTPGGYAVFEWE